MDTTRLFQSFCALFPILEYVVRDFADALAEAHTTKEHLRFLRECRDEQVIPRSLITKSLLKLEDQPFGEIQRAILEKHINIKILETKKNFEDLARKRRHFEVSIPSDWKDSLREYCYVKMRNKVYWKLKRTHDNKLRLLIERSPWTTNANHECVVNLSNKHLERNVTSALGYGLNFALSTGGVNSVEITKGLCNLEKYSDLTSEEVNIVKGVIYGSMKSQSVTSNVPKRFLAAIKELKKDKNIHMTKADKSGALVIMNKSEYIEKMDSLLGDESTYKELNKNPLESVNSGFNKKVKTLLKGNETLIKKLCVISPSLPYMYGTIKTHKTNLPARPIISSVGSASYKLAKYLVDILNPLVGTISNANIKNNVDLINKLNSVQINSESRLVSFDVTSLFTKVPIDDLIEFLSETLENIQLDIPFSKKTLIELIKLCVKECKFEFNGKFYSQNFGMAMGNPLSPVLSNLYMEFFEKKILSSIIPRNVVWFRYVDDIICVWPGNEDVNNFFDRLNQLVPSIKFTMEMEKDGCLPFLDVFIRRKSNVFKYSVYRKPTNISSYVHFYSGQNKKVKTSVFTSMFLRALRICSPEYIDEEIVKIRNTGKKLKYPDSVLDYAFEAAKKTMYQNQKEPYNTKNLLVLPFNNNMKNIPHLLKNFGVNVAFKNDKTIKQVLIKNSPDSTKGCVYKVPCKSCNNFYIGQTGKTLEKRIEQHKKCVRYAQMNSGIFVHVSEKNHAINWEGAEKIVFSNNVMERNIIESSFIKETFGHNMNISQGMYKLDPLISKEICKTFKFVT